MKNTKKYRGFTLIELLVVCAIIAILSGIVITSLAGSRAKARDGKRVSDVAQIQLALEQQFDHTNSYPFTLSGLNSAYISAVPTPPVAAGCSISQYDYAVPRPSETGLPTNYALHTCLENTNSVVLDGLPASYFIGWEPRSFTCNNNSGSTDYCVGPK